MLVKFPKMPACRGSGYDTKILLRGVAPTGSMGASRPALLFTTGVLSSPLLLDMPNPNQAYTRCHMKHYAASISVCVYMGSYDACTLHAHLLLHQLLLRSAPPSTVPRWREQSPSSM